MSEADAPTLWLTGLPCAGKSTLAAAIRDRLLAEGRPMRVLDGDEIRRGLCSDLGFTARERSENVRRTAEVARLFNEIGVLVVVALISPLVADRDTARRIIGADRFVEVYVSASAAIREKRDVKGLYARARRGELSGLTGVDAPYEPPEAPTLTIDTGALDVAQCVAKLSAAISGQRSSPVVIGGSGT